MPNTHTYNLLKHPIHSLDLRLDQADPTGKEIAIGDLHANPIKLIHLMISEGIISLDEPTYDSLVQLYLEFPELENLEKVCQENPDLIKNMLAHYDKLIENIQLKCAPKKLVLIGDETGDRGTNDYFIISLIRRINNLRTSWQLSHETNCFDMDILCSNHGFEFLSRIIREPLTMHAVTPTVFPCSSVDALATLLLYKCLDGNEFAELVNQSGYFTNLKLLSCSVHGKVNGRDQLTIYSHAPINFKALAELAQNLDLNYSADNTVQLQDTCNKINQQFIAGIINLQQNPSQDVQDAFFAKIWPALWSVYREHAKDDDFNVADYQHPLLDVEWVHGHDSINNSELAAATNAQVTDWKQILGLPDNITCTDDILGKARTTFQGKTTIYCHPGFQQPVAKNTEEATLKHANPANAQPKNTTKEHNVTNHEPVSHSLQEAASHTAAAQPAKPKAVVFSDKRRIAKRHSPASDLKRGTLIIRFKREVVTQMDSTGQSIQKPVYRVL